MRRARRDRQSGITLVELLAAMIVMGILTTMIIASWATLSKAYSFTTRSDKQRDVANQAMSRMAREIRDAQAVPGGTSGAFTRAYPYEVRFYSTFNMGGAPDPTTTPRLTRFILRGGAIYRELPGTDGLFDSGDDVSYLLVKDVVNQDTGHDLFKYSAINSTTGQMYRSNGTTTLVPPPRSRR